MLAGHGSFSDRPPAQFNSRSEECNAFNRGSDLEINKNLCALCAFACPVQFFAEDKRSEFNWGGSRFKIQIYSININ